jgi:hypothetical protein
MTLKLNGVAVNGPGRKVIHQCPPNCGKEHGGKPKCNNWHCKVCGNYCICSECHGLMFGKSKDTCKVCKKEWDDRPKGGFFESWGGGGDCTGRSLLYSEPADSFDGGIIRVVNPKRVTVPVFEIASCPSISIDEIRKRRFKKRG